MTPAEIAAILDEKFGPKITAKKFDAAGFDPCVTVDVASLVEICQFLCDDPRLKFEMLSCVSGVDYLEIDPKKLAKAGVITISPGYCADRRVAWPGGSDSVRWSSPAA